MLIQGCGLQVTFPYAQNNSFSSDNVIKHPIITLSNWALLLVIGYLTRKRFYWQTFSLKTFQ